MGPLYAACGGNRGCLGSGQPQLLKDLEGNLVERRNVLLAVNEAPLRVALWLSPDKIAENAGVSPGNATVVPPAFGAFHVTP